MGAGVGSLNPSYPAGVLAVLPTGDSAFQRGEPPVDVGHVPADVGKGGGQPRFESRQTAVETGDLTPQESAYREHYADCEVFAHRMYSRVYHANLTLTAVASRAGTRRHCPLEGEGGGGGG